VYGCERGGRAKGRVDNAYVRHYVTGGLELVALALDYLAHTHDGAFASRVLAPLARAVMAWFSEHYHRSQCAAATAGQRPPPPPPLGR
jgi:hypothetical protein